MRVDDFFADIDPYAQRAAAVQAMRLCPNDEAVSFLLLRKRVQPSTKAAKRIFDGAGAYNLSHHDQMHFLCALAHLGEQAGFGFNVALRNGDTHKIFIDPRA